MTQEDKETSESTMEEAARALAAEIPVVPRFEDWAKFREETGCVQLVSVLAIDTGNYYGFGSKVFLTLLNNFEVVSTIVSVNRSYMIDLASRCHVIIAQLVSQYLHKITKRLSIIIILLISILLAIKISAYLGNHYSRTYSLRLVSKRFTFFSVCGF